MLPLINQPYIKKLFGGLADANPVSHFINQHGFYIGCHDHLSTRELQYIKRVFDEFFRLKGVATGGN